MLYEPIDGQGSERFILTLIGREASPPQLGDLKNVVEIPGQISQRGFYQRMASTDVLLRAWSVNATCKSTQV